MKRGVGGEIQLPFVAHDHRAAVDQQFAQRQDHQQYREEHEAVVTPLDLAEAAQLFERLWIK